MNNRDGLEEKGRCPSCGDYGLREPEPFWFSDLIEWLPDNVGWGICDAYCWIYNHTVSPYKCWKKERSEF